MPVKLTDEQVAAIAWAPATDPTADLARRIGANYGAVAMRRKNLQRAGGWYCSLTIVTCTECGQPLLTSSAGNQRTAHKHCEAARMRRKSAERRAAGTMPTSTPYVAAWRQGNPERNQRLRVNQRVVRRGRERERRAAGAPIRDDATRLAAMAAREREEQDASRQGATAHKANWTSAEDDLLRGTMHLPNREVAARLGRTLYAVKSRRRWLRERGLAPAPHRAGDDTPPEHIPRYGQQTRRP